MCGLVGMAGYGICTPDLKMFKDLLYVSSLRGPDATGVATIRSRSTTHGITLRKSAINSPDFLEIYGGVTSYLHDLKKDIYIGHTRWATTGEKTAMNAHPFDVGRIIGAHNGTLMEGRYYSKKMTDSELMFKRMQSIGIKETLEELYSASAYAVSIYDRGTRKLTLARNIERPLFVAISKERDVLFWASEMRYLNFAANNSDVKAKLDIYRLEPNILYEIDISEIKAGNDMPWTCTDLKPATPWWEESDYPTRFQGYGGTSTQTGSAFINKSAQESAATLFKDHIDDVQSNTTMDHVPLFLQQQTKSDISNILDEVMHPDLNDTRRDSLDDKIPF